MPPFLFWGLMIAYGVGGYLIAVGGGLGSYRTGWDDCHTLQVLGGIAGVGCVGECIGAYTLTQRENTSMAYFCTFVRILKCT